MAHRDQDLLQPDDTHPAMIGSLVCPEGVKPLNFSPGPTSLAAEVEASIKTLFDTERICSMYLSHRSPEFLEILSSTVQNCRVAMDIPEQYEILFMHGGGHGQFAAVPLNLCPLGDEKATYLVNGTWSKRAQSEASKYCHPLVVSSENKDGTFTHNPSFDYLDPESKYVYLCSNETVNGIEMHQLPKLSIQAPLVVDASSDFSTKPIDWVGCNVGVLYACASKNIGHPGVTLCVIRKDLLGTPSQLCPGVLCYSTNVRAGNLWNTIATFNVEVINIYMQWMIAQGGVHEMERRAKIKSALVYELIDGSNGFFSTPLADRSIRSRMNVPFDVAGGNEEITRKFLIQGWERGIVGLRTLTPFGVGKYLRASLYNGVSVQQVETLVEYMNHFMKDFHFNNR
jgi:phosphoserine aminotransferase